MSTTFPLPLECLQIIIRYIAQDRKLAHLLPRLLRVNKYVCNATLPILYENPFKNIYFRYKLPPPRPKTVERAFWRLTLTLILSIPPDDHNSPLLTDMLRAAYLPPRIPTPNAHRVFIPYYSFVTDLVIISGYRGPPRDDAVLFHGSILTLIPNFNKQLNDPQVREILATSAQPGGHFRSASTIEYTKAAGLVLRKDFTWLLCSLNAEHIQSVVIPLSDISRYHSLVGRFKVLSSVTFFIDLRLQLNGEERSRLSPQELETLKRQLKERVRDLNEMVRFIQELRQCHPHVLTTASCPTPGTSRDSCPEEYNFQLLQCLPPLNSPTVIKETNWLQLIAKIQETDLSHVKVFFQHWSFWGVNHLERLRRQEPFLNRCRSLGSIEITLWSEDLFKWAVAERREAMAEIAAGRTPKKPLVPLRLAKINCESHSDGCPIDDVMIGFSETLESLDVTSHFIRGSVAPSDNDLPDFRIGRVGITRYCDFPHLTRLTIATSNHFLRMDPTFLSRLPSVQCLIAKDRRRIYSIEEVSYWSPAPATLPRLAHIALDGTPAISFHPDTLLHTPNLVHLSLGLSIRISSHTFIPPVEDLNVNGGLEQEQEHEEGAEVSTPAAPTPSTIPQQPKRPAWSWDWALSKLEVLTLNSTFAYEFQFRMLEKTPRLGTLFLNIKTQVRQHPRTIHLRDLPLTPNTVTTTTSALISPPTTGAVIENVQKREKARIDQQQQQQQQHSLQDHEYASLPLLRDLYLIGDWSMDDTVLAVLFGKVAPSITDLAMTGGCRGFTLDGWINHTSENLHSLKSARCSLELNGRPERLEALGLVRVNNGGGPAMNPCYNLVVPPEGRNTVLERPADYVFGQ
ncbi:MAG: hypothetical protein JOS17DRAFT_270083 [Linnemannia elongata]|nr:MAG: hypothetical protein JOS17DRAFT_270083 [Linnemannia elongata]